MRSDFFRLLKRFESDERGAFLVLFGVLALVLIATAGAVVDFTTIEQARTRAQDALDSAALGLQPTIFDAGVTAATIEPKAQNLIDERLGNEDVTADITSVQISTTDGMLRLEADLTIPTSFVSLVGVSQVQASILSEATRKRLNVEVAMVLDNSGSMGFDSPTRMSKLKEAAQCAVNILLNNVSNCDTATMTATTPLASTISSVKIAIIPFTGMVNVGTGMKNTLGMDLTGASSISNDNFDTDDNEATAFTSAVDRFALYDTLTNVDWDGCVEARPYPYDTNDTAPTPGVPDTYFVPAFAPDNPDSGGYSNNYESDTGGSCPAIQTWTFTWTQNKFSCNKDAGSGSFNTRKNNYDTGTCSGGGAMTNSYATTNGAGVTTTTSTAPSPLPPASFNNDSGELTAETYTRVSGSGPSGYNNRRVMTWTYTMSPRERQERKCKYSGTVDLGSGWSTRDGPNGDCPTNAITPLTNTKATINAAITAMSPQGYTNIHQGSIWGLHVLTSTVPFTEGLPATNATYKIMIVMTDGENTVDGYDSSNMNKSSGYMAYGYPGAPVASPGTSYNGRIYSTTNPTPSSDSQVTEAMDARTVASCASAKALGITVFTIGLATQNTSNPAKVEQMLKDCSNGTGYWFFPTNSSELVDTFKTIASQLADLRLAK